MKRTYQGYSGSGPANPNLPAPPLSYPPLPSGAPPPQPAPNGQPPPPTSQPYQYNHQFAGAAPTPYGQYPGYPPQPQATTSYAAPATAAMGTYSYAPQLPANPQQQQPQQQQQQPQQQQQQHQQPAQQQPRHPAFPNYGYGTPAGPQQPPKVGQAYQSYSHQSTSNQLPANPNVHHTTTPTFSLPSNSNQGPPVNIAYHPQTPQYPNPNNPNIPANPYTGYATPGQPNPSPLQGSPGSVAPPPYKRPRYEAGAGVNNAYSAPNSQQPHVYPLNPPQTHNPPPPALPPLRNQNTMTATTPTPIRMGTNTNNNRGNFGGGRGPRTSGGGAFGNNSPIRLGLGTVGTFDASGPPQFETPHPHVPTHMAHPLPPHHGPPAQHYQSNVPAFGANNNSNAVNETHYPPQSGPHHGPNYNSTNPNDHSHANMNAGHLGGNDPMRMNNNNFSHPDPSGYPTPANSNPNDNYGFHDDNRSTHLGGNNRANRGGFRGGGNNAGGGRTQRDRGSDYGGDNHGGNRGARGGSNNMYGSGNRGDRHGSGTRGRSVGNNGRYDDHSSNYGGNGPRTGSTNDRMNGNSNNRGTRNISHLPTMGGNNKSGHGDRRNGGRFSNAPLPGDRSGRGGRRNGRDGKFDDHKHQNRGPRGNNAQGNNPGTDRHDRERSGPSTSTRVKNGWGAQFKEFNEREKEKEKKEEVASTKRTLTDFRINALDIPDLTWSWLAENTEAVQIDSGATAVVTSNVEEKQPTTLTVPTTDDTVVGSSKTGKHGRDEDEQDDTSGLSPANPTSTASVTSSTATITACAKKVKSDATVELAKKIDEEAASAVKGLNLTVDEYSEQEESIVSDEVKNQLVLVKDEPSTPANLDSVTGSSVGAVPVVPHNATSVTDLTNIEDSGSKEDKKQPKDAQPDPSVPRPTIPDPQTPLALRDRERIHSYSKPTIPAGRENSRLRLYFSSPANVPTEPPPPPPPICASLPNKPTTSLIGNSGKRKLSISANSAMSVDTRIGGGGGGRGSSPAISPAKGPNKGTKAAKVSSDVAGSIHEISEPNRATGQGVEPKPAEDKLESGSATDPVIIKDPRVTHKVSSNVDEKAKPENSSTTEPNELSLEPEIAEKEKNHPTTNGTEGVKSKTGQEDYDEDQDADGDYEDEDDYEGPPMPEPQADRLSISYARNTRRMVIDSDVVESIKVYRAEHKIEVLVRLIPAIIQGGKYDGEFDEYRVCKGVLVEALDQDIDDYVIIDRATLEAVCNAEDSKPKSGATKPTATGGTEEPSSNTTDNDEGTQVEDDYEVIHDPLLPPLHRLFISSLQPPPTSEDDKVLDLSEDQNKSSLKVTSGFKQNTILIVAKLDTANPLTEAKWVRTGDVDSWISQMTGRIFKPEDKAECGWRRKITVVDPDPPPTIQHLLDTWLTTSTLGSIDTRQRFIDRHVTKNVDIIIEILLRVVRSGNTGNNNSHHHMNPMPLIVQQAATLHAPYPEQQTQVSLAVLGLYRLSIETAIEAGISIDKVVKKATDIVRSLPYRLAFSALDGIYKDETPS